MVEVRNIDAHLSFPVGFLDHEDVGKPLGIENFQHNIGS